MRKAIYIGILTFLLGLYFTIPVFLFDCNKPVIVLKKTNIDKLHTLSEEFLTYLDKESGKPRDEESGQKAIAVADEYKKIEAEGEESYSLRFQKVFYTALTYKGYQKPHVVRSLFPCVAYIGHIFSRNTDEYLGWLWFSLLCINIAYYIHIKVCNRWKENARVIASSRWLFFCAGAMGASMLLGALLESYVPSPFVGIASRILSGPAYVLDQYVYSISSMIIWERLILYSAIQWVLIGAIGCIVIKCLKGKNIGWNTVWYLIAITFFLCAGLGLFVARAPKDPMQMLFEIEQFNHTTNEPVESISPQLPQQGTRKP